jgi:hypothetical protein
VAGSVIALVFIGANSHVNRYQVVAPHINRTLVFDTWTGSMWVCDVGKENEGEIGCYGWYSVTGDR